MELKDITKKFERKNIGMTIRITKSNRKYMKENNISPQLLFDMALKEFMEKSK